MTPFVELPDCLELGLRAGAIVLRDVEITAASADLRSLIDEEVKCIQGHYSTTGDIRALPEIAKLYEILRSVGVKPRSHPPSTQKLLEFALKRGTLPEVNNLVDAYNLVSLRTKCSLGAHDLDRLQLPVQLRLFRGNESFRPLGNGQDSQVNQGEFGYVDSANRVVCRLDSLQAEFSKVTPKTKNALLIIESTTVHDAKHLENLFSETIATVQQFCDGSAQIVALPYCEPKRGSRLKRD